MFGVQITKTISDDIQTINCKMPPEKQNYIGIKIFIAKFHFMILVTFHSLPRLRGNQQIFPTIWPKLEASDREHLWSTKLGHWQCIICYKHQILWAEERQWLAKL